MNQTKIALLTTVCNFELYNKTSKLFPEGIELYVIDGRNGMHGIDSLCYMFKVLKDKNIDYLILADEDVVFKDSQVVFSLVEKMINENCWVCGVRDGGIIQHRVFNPNVVNTFFTILNFREIAKIWRKEEIFKNQYVKEGEFSTKGVNFKSNYDEMSLYEPYYCFFLWLKRNGSKFIYLDSDMADDGITNKVKFNDRFFLYHTWYARSYNKNEKHTVRINTILEEEVLGRELRETENVVVFYDLFFNLKRRFRKYKAKFIKKVMLK